MENQKNFKITRETYCGLLWPKIGNIYMWKLSLCHFYKSYSALDNPVIASAMDQDFP